MKLIKVCELKYHEDINVWGTSYPTSYIELDIDINKDAVESVVKTYIDFYKPKYTVRSRPTLFGLGKPEEVTYVEEEFSHKEEFLKLTMFSGEKFLTKDNTLSNLKVNNDDNPN